MCAVLERGQINDEGVDFLWLSQGFRGYYGELRGSTMFFYADEQHETVNSSRANNTHTTHTHTHTQNTHTHTHTHSKHTHTHTHTHSNLCKQRCHAPPL